MRLETYTQDRNGVDLDEKEAIYDTKLLTVDTC